MTAVLHVIDQTCDETQLQVLQSLRRHLSTEARPHTLCSLDPAMAHRASVHTGQACDLASHRLCRLLNWVPQLKMLARTANPQLIHAWGAEAATACSAQLSRLPMVITLLDPAATCETANWLRSLPQDATVVAGSQIIRSRLIRSGIDPEQCVVIRGPADFGLINQARRDGLRQQIVGSADPVILMNGPASRDGGQFSGIWATAILKKVFPKLAVLMPYDSPERRRCQRFAQQTGDPTLLRLGDSRLTWPRLAACADVFLMPAVGEVCTEPLGSAMAAGLVVVATAVRSIAEIIADCHNGLLCKDAQPRRLAARLLHALEDRSLVKNVVDVARGQAFEVFGMRDFLDNYRQVYQNVLSGKPVGQNVRDTAMIS